MTTKHTPGPWETYTPYPPGLGVWVRSTSTDKAKQGWILAICRDLHISTTQNEANGRLIATAPELLEACKALRDACALIDARLDVERRAAGEDDYILAGVHEQLKERIEDARAAISKATGE